MFKQNQIDALMMVPSLDAIVKRLNKENPKKVQLIDIISIISSFVILMDDSDEASKELEFLKNKANELVFAALDIEREKFPERFSSAKEMLEYLSQKGICSKEDTEIAINLIKK